MPYERPPGTQATVAQKLTITDMRAPVAGAPEPSGPPYFYGPPAPDAYRDYGPLRGLPPHDALYAPGLPEPPMHLPETVDPTTRHPSPRRMHHEPLEYMPMPRAPEPMLPYRGDELIPRGRPGPLMREPMPVPEPLPMREPMPLRAPLKRVPPPPPVEPSASKRDRRRRDILDRLERTHWDAMDKREATYQDAYVALTSTYQTLLTRPTLVREYATALADQALERNAAIRKATLYYAFLAERSQHSYNNERTKIEDEARSSKRSVRDKLLGVVEERKRRLREERDGGDFAADFLVDSQRHHTTRQLRNKGASSSTPTRLGRLFDDDDTPRSNGISVAVAQLLGWSELDAETAIVTASASENGSILCIAPDGTQRHLPLHETFASHTSLLSGVNLTSNTSKGKKKGGNSKLSTMERNEDEEGSPAPLLSSGGGRLRWDTAKCLSQLTSAKDFEVDSDLINIRKIGPKRRRR